MSKVVYLLGAGASYGKRANDRISAMNSLQASPRNFITEGIPIVNEINSELEVIIQELKKSYPNYQENGNKIGTLIKDMNWLKTESERHMTIDTFAKKLYLQNNIVDFERLKKTLSSFFIIVQLKYPLDKRYDAFLANILTFPNKQIPDDITLLTWNYDSQFEIAYREFNSTSQPTPSFWRNVRCQLGIKDSHDKETENGKIYKLNGTAMFDYFESFSLLGESCDTDCIEIYSDIAEAHCQFKAENHLYFAWETVPESLYFKDIFSKLHDTETLVIIGYTFPYFNRQIDRAIFEQLLSLKTVYIQDPNPERIAQNLSPVLSKLHKTTNVKIVLLKDVDQFYLPSEL